MTQNRRGRGDGDIPSFTEIQRVHIDTESHNRPGRPVSRVATIPVKPPSKAQSIVLAHPVDERARIRVVEWFIR